MQFVSPTFVSYTVGYIRLGTVMNFYSFAYCGTTWALRMRQAFTTKRVTYGEILPIFFHCALVPEVTVDVIH